MNRIEILRKLDYKILGSLTEEELKLYLLLLVSSGTNPIISGLDFATLCRALHSDFDERKLSSASRKFARLGLGKIYLLCPDWTVGKRHKRCRLNKSTIVFFKPEIPERFSPED